jgi:hypothetical protein
MQRDVKIDRPRARRGVWVSMGVVVTLTYTHPHSNPGIELVWIFDDRCRYRSKPVCLKVVSEPLLCLDIDN